MTGNGRVAKTAARSFPQPPVAGNRRMSQVALTDAGRTLHLTLAGVARRANACLVAGLTEDDAGRLRALLDHVRANVSGRRAEDGPVK